MEAGARADEEETAEAELLKAVKVRLPLADHAAVSPPQDDVDKCSRITRGYYPGATYAKFNAADQQKVY